MNQSGKSPQLYETKQVPSLAVGGAIRRGLEAAGNIPASLVDAKLRNKKTYKTGSGGGGNCTRRTLSSSPYEQAVCAIQILLLQHFSRAFAVPNKSPRPTSISTAFGSARTNALPLELCGQASHLPFLLRTSVRHTEALSTRLGASVDVTDALA